MSSKGLTPALLTAIILTLIAAGAFMVLINNQLGVAKASEFEIVNTINRVISTLLGQYTPPEPTSGEPHPVGCENNDDCPTGYECLPDGTCSLITPRSCDEECKDIYFYDSGECVATGGGPSATLPYTGVGADYLWRYINEPVSVWTLYTWTTGGVTYNGHIDLANKYWMPLGFNVDKICFAFPDVGRLCSYYDETKFDQVLSLFDTRSVKVIAAMYPSWDAQYNGDGYCGSPKLTADWLAFTERWKDDDRIAAFNLYGEPVGAVDNGMGTGTISWHSSMTDDRKKLARYFVELIRSIHEIDPDRVVIYPYMGLSYWYPQDLFDDLEEIRQETGIDIFQEPYTIFDITHPYYFDIPAWNEGDPVQKAVSYESREVITWVNKVGSSKVWCGETFMFVGYAQGMGPDRCANSNGLTNYVYSDQASCEAAASSGACPGCYWDSVGRLVDLQKQHDFFVELLNVFVRNKVGFDILGLLTAAPGYVATNLDHQVSLNDFHTTAIEDSNFDASLTSGTGGTTPSENLGAIPNIITYNEYGYPFAGTWGLAWKDNIPPYAFVESGGHDGQNSLRLEMVPATSPIDNQPIEYVDRDREVNSEWFNTPPGTRLIFRAWIKTGNSATLNGNPIYGARIGVDFIGCAEAGAGCGGDGCCRTYATYGSGGTTGWVPWGTSSWSFTEIDFTVPDTYYDINQDWGFPDFNKFMTPRQIDGAILWLQTLPVDEPATDWFSDVELYICYPGDPDYETCGESSTPPAQTCSGTTIEEGNCPSGYECCCSGTPHPPPPPPESCDTVCQDNSFSSGQCASETTLPTGKASEILGRGTFGNQWSNFGPEVPIQKAASVGVKNIIQGGVGYAMDNGMVWSPAMTDISYLWGGYVDGVHVHISIEEHMRRSAQEAHRLGLLYGMQSNIAYDGGETYRKIIYNIDGFQDKYIALVKKAIEVTDADFVDVLNEPLGDIDWEDDSGNVVCTGCSASADYKNAYSAFLINAIDSWRTTKSDLIVVVQGVPFWSLESCIENPVPRENVVYALHNYYSYSGEKPASYPQWIIDYWDGNFAQGKVNLEKFIITDPLVPQALANGMDVWFEETGCMIGNPNDEIAMKDYWDLMDKYGLNFNVLMNQPTWSDYPMMWLDDGSLSDVGQVWVNYLDTSTDRFWWGAVCGSCAWGDDTPGSEYGWGDIFGQSQVDVLYDSGASSMRIMLDKYAWDTGTTINKLGLPYKDYIKAMVQYLHSKGMKVLLDLCRDSNYGDEFDVSGKDTVITDSTRRTAWINWGKEVISYCKPDAISVMNEPRGGGTTFAYYHDNFVLPSISAYKSSAAAAGISDFKIFVMGYPFYDPHQFVGTYAINDEDVIYEYHCYYQPFPTDGTSGTLNSVSTKFYNGDIAGGTAALNNYLDNELSGLPLNRVNLAEVGVFRFSDHLWTSNPTEYLGWQEFMNAIYNYVKNKGLHGLHQYQIGYIYQLLGWDGSDYTMLTPYGEVWADNTPSQSVVGTPTCTSGDLVLSSVCPSGGCCCFGSAPPPEPGLVAHWRFDESTGTTAPDSSGYNNIGTLINGPSWTTSGKINNALQFDGSNDYVTVPDSNSLNVDYITLSAWVYVNSYIDDQRIICKEYSTVEPYNIYTLLFSGTFGDNRKIEFRFTRDGHSLRDVVTSNSIIPLNTWTHVAATYDGSKVVLYVNGNPDKTVYSLPGTIMDNNRPVWIGGSELWSPRFFDGKIDEVKIWNRALTASEIYEEYYGAPEPPPPPEPINGPFIGLSGYPTSTSNLQQIINVMNSNGMNIYRMSFNPEWFSTKPHPYQSNYVQYFLDNTPSDWVIIVDRNHIYPNTEAGASDFRTNINTARNSILEVCNAWHNNPRVWIELANEYVSTDFNSVFQGLINDVRSASCFNTLVIDKWNTGWSTADFVDSQNAVYTGMHFYFNTWSPSGAETQMGYALDRNLNVINTEVGADYDEYDQFSTSEVQELNDFLQWSFDNGISNTIWMNENLDNWNTYQNLGLVIPNSNPPSNLPNLPPSTQPPVTQPSGSVVYVDAVQGSSSGSGSSSSPLQTIQQGLSRVTSGGTIEVRNGQYQGPITISNFYTSPVLIRAASGANPVIDCSKRITGWQLHSGSIYKVQTTENVAAVFYNDEFLQRSRYPTNTYLSVAADAPNKNKYTVVMSDADRNYVNSNGGVKNMLATVRYIDWWATTSVVTSLSGSNLNLLSTSSPLIKECSRNQLITFDPACWLIYEANESWGYYLENEVWMMNEGNWAFDWNNNELYVWLPEGVNPNNVEVRYANPDDCITVENTPNLAVQGLTIKNSGGSGVVAMIGSTGSRWNKVTMKNIKFIGFLLRAPFIIDESSVSKTGQDAVNVPSSGKVIIESSIFTDINTALGPRKSSAAIWQDSSNPTGSIIRNNYLARIGYNGIFSANGAIVEGNTIEDFCLLFDDCGGIYSFMYDSGHNVRNNIVRRATASNTQQGKPAGRGAYPVTGIYLDLESQNMVVENNFISDTDIGIYINGRDNVFRNNNIVGFALQGVELKHLSGGEFREGEYSLRNNQFEGNVFADKKRKPILFFYRWPGEEYQLQSVYIGNGNYYWNFFSSDLLKLYTGTSPDSFAVASFYNFDYFNSLGLDSYPHHPTDELFSDAPENHIQGIANADHLETKTFPCPNGICNGWTDKTGTQFTFPLTLAPRESKVIWHDGSEPPSMVSYTSPSIPSNTWDGWRSRTEKENQWNTLWNSNGLGSKIHIAGQSVEGRNIYLYEAGNPSAPTLFVDAQMHGNEDHGYEILTMFAYWLLNSGDADAQNILQNNRILFMPMVDVDRTTKLPDFTRCNANNVNLNRNFVSGFGSSGNNDPTDCINYRGPSAGSEPETQTVKGVFTTYKPKVYVNLHTGAFMARAYGDSTLYNEIRQGASSFTSYFNPGYTSSIGGGMAVGDAIVDSPGSSAWLIEFFRASTTDPEYHAWRHDATNLDMNENRYYPLFKDFMISALQSIQN